MIEFYQGAFCVELNLAYPNDATCRLDSASLGDMTDGPRLLVRRYHIQIGCTTDQEGFWHILGCQ